MVEVPAPFGALGYGLTAMDDNKSGHPPLSKGAIIAIVCVVAALILLVAAILVYCLCCKAKTRAAARVRATPALAVIGRSSAAVVSGGAGYGVDSGEVVAVRLDCGHSFH